MQRSVNYCLAGLLRWCEFDGDWVVYCTTTGALRHADKPTAAVLAMLEESPASAADVARRIAAETEITPTDEVMLGIGDLLDELQRVGFLEREAT